MRTRTNAIQQPVSDWMQKGGQPRKELLRFRVLVLAGGDPGNRRPSAPMDAATPERSGLVQDSTPLVEAGKMRRPLKEFAWETIYNLSIVRLG